MSDTAGPTGRALALLSLLQTHRSWSGIELAERLGVSQRTLRRDVDRLRTFGYPVDATTGTNGGYRLAAGAHLPPLLLDDDEAVAIAVGLRSTATASIEGMGDTSARALAKLEQVLPDRLRRRVTAIHANITPLQWEGRFGPGVGPTVDPGSLALLAQGCRDHEQVRFDYRRRDAEESSRLVEPHQLVTAGRRWYLVAFDVRRDDWRSFRVDRLTEPRLAGVRFAARPIPGGDAAAYVAQSIGAMPRPHGVTATLRLPLDEARAALRWLDVELDTGPDAASCTARFRSESIDGLAVGVAVATLVATVDVTNDVEVEADDRGALRERLSTLAGRLEAVLDGLA